MPIDKISANQFREQLRTGISSRTTAHDVGYGPIRDIVIDPVAAVLERQNDRIRQVSLLVSLINSTEFSDADLDALVFNEGVTRLEGGQATGTVVFSTLTVDTAGLDLVVQRGYPIATLPDASSGETVTFVTTEARTLTAASAASYFNIATGRYELSVPVIAVAAGTSGNVGATRINRSLRALIGFDEVTNPTSTSGGRARETNAELIERYLLSIQGRDLVTPLGIERYARDAFANVEDITTVYGSNTLLTRTATTAGGVDAYVIGDQLLTRTDTSTFLGVNQVIAVQYPPLRDILTVSVGATTYVEGVDYEVVQDSTDLQNSTRAVDGIRFLPDDSVAPAPPATGAVVTIEYTSNDLIRQLQTTFELDDKFVFGRDLLFKEGLQVAIILEARLRVASGFGTTAVLSTANAAILSFINALQLGENVEASDIQGEVRRISGVDNFIITRLVRSSAATGVTDIDDIADNEYPRLAQADLTLTLI